MYRPFRARRILKWTGTAISLLILVAWVGSLWCALNLVFSEYCGAFIDAGTVAIIRMNEHWLRGATAAGEFEWHGWDGFHFGWPRAEFNSIAPDSQTVRMSLVVLPLWLPFLLTAIPTAWLWHRDRRRIRPGCCIRCGYDLTGNTSGVCPECGDKARPPAVWVDSECEERFNRSMIVRSDNPVSASQRTGDENATQASRDIL